MAQTIDALFRQLQKDLQAEEYGNAVATADKVLKSNAKDADAIQIKTTALLKTNQFAAALQTAGDSKDLVFERAYALYRLNDYDKCKQLLAEVDSGDKTEGYQQLEAQLYYRMGDYSKAAELYEAIGKSSELDPELVTNILAAYVSAGLGSKALSFAQSVEKKVEATHEIAYNRACGFIEAGDLATAAKWLETAKKSCQQTLTADGASKEEIDDEMSVLLVQSAYLAQLKGDAEAALQLYTTVLGQKPSDQAVVATAANNSLSLMKNDRLFESQKRMDRALKVPVEKLSVRQRTTLRLNQSLLHVIGKKLDKAREEAEALHKQFPDDELPVLILATVAHREKNVPLAVQTLKDYIASHPNNSIQSQLTLAHLSLLQGDTAQALSTLQSIPSIAHKPATVAVLVKLQEQQADGAAAAVKTIDAALSHWESKKGQDPAASRTYSLLVEQAAAYFLANGQHAKALGLYQKILSGKDKDPRILSKLILASAKSDPAAASKYAAQLPALEGAAAVDVKSLEAISAPRKSADRDDAGPAGEEKLAVYDPRARTKAAAEGKLQTDADAAAKAAAKRKKKKKKRLPKGFDPANPGPPPDPERWLPKWERSYNKKARKAKLKQQALRGAQGSTGSSDNLDASQGAVFNNEPKAAATAKASSNLPRNRRRRG